MKDITELPYEYSHGKNGPIFFSFFFVIMIIKVLMKYCTKMLKNIGVHTLLLFEFNR